MAASVFERYRVSLYKQAGNKPYIIAAMILLSKVKEPQALLRQWAAGGTPRWQN